MSRAISDLAPFFKPKAQVFLSRCEAAGYPLRITRTLTTELVQGALYAVGRRPLTIEEERALREEGLYPDSLMRVRTNAERADATPHGPIWEGKALGFDVVPLINGQPWWAAPDNVWKAIYKIAEQCGLDALGDRWGQFMSQDKGHFQEPGWWLLKGV